MKYAKRMRMKPYLGIGLLAVWAALAAWVVVTRGADQLAGFLANSAPMYALGAFILLCPLPKRWQRKDPLHNDEVRSPGPP